MEKVTAACVEVLQRRAALARRPGRCGGRLRGHRGTDAARWCRPSSTESGSGPSTRSSSRRFTLSRLRRRSCTATARSATCCGIVEIGVDAINPVQTSARGMEPRRLKRAVGRSLVLWGGFDAAEAFVFGSAAGRDTRGESSARRARAGRRVRLRPGVSDRGERAARARAQTGRRGAGPPRPRVESVQNGASARNAFVRDSPNRAAEEPATLGAWREPIYCCPSSARHAAVTRRCSKEPSRP